MMKPDQEFKRFDVDKVIGDILLSFMFQIGRYLQNKLIIHVKNYRYIKGMTRLSGVRLHCV